MSGSTAVPFATLGPLGYILPAESAVLTGAQQDINTAFGGDLNFTTADGGVTNPTPQGQLATSQSAIIGESNSLFLRFTNLVDPAFSSGRMQDAIGRIYFITRNPAQPTVVEQVVCSGLNGTNIPVGALLGATDGNSYLATAAGTVVNGSVTLPFVCMVTGPIVCPPQTFTIARTIPGWDSAISSTDGVLGNVVESPADFEFRRSNSVAQNARGTLPAIEGAVLSVPNVIDAYVTDNTAGTAQTVGGVLLAANSLFVCVAGGAAQAIGQAIWSKKQPGGPYTGNTTVSVIDSNSGYTTPPAYNVTFETAVATETFFYVAIANSALVPSNAVDLIDAAITTAFTGADGGLRARIGSTIYASRYYAGIASLGAWAQIVSIQLGVTAATFTATITGTAFIVRSTPVGTIAAGQMLVGPGVTPGTTIVSGSGTSWVVNIPQTISLTALTSVAMGNSLTYNINQVPTLSDDNIIVVT
jgi:hypothetical protein